MSIIEILVGILITAGTAWLGGMQLKVRQMDSRLLKAVSREEVKELIYDKLEITKLQLEVLKDDLEKIDAKLDKILNEDK